MSRPIVEAAIASLVLRARIVWVALLIGPVLFLCAITWLSQQEQYQPSLENSTLLVIAGWLAAVALPFLGLVLRGLFARTDSKRADIVIQKWFGGQVVGWAMCEAGAFTAIILLFLTGSVGAFLPPAILALVFQILLFPRRN